MKKRVILNSLATYDGGKHFGTLEIEKPTEILVRDYNDLSKMRYDEMRWAREKTTISIKRFIHK